MITIDQLGLFKQWLDLGGHKHREGKGDYQVLQVLCGTPDSREGLHWAPLWRNDKNTTLSMSSRALLALVVHFTDGTVSPSADPHLCPRCKEILRKALEQLL